jgi:hypothetical protein
MFGVLSDLRRSQMLTPGRTLSYVFEANEWVSKFFVSKLKFDASQRPERLAVVDPDHALRARIG